MKNGSSLLLLIVALMLVVAGSAPPAQAAPGEPRWVLVDVIDVPNRDKWDAANQHKSYAYEEQYARGSYSVKTIYEGPTDNYYKPPYIQGEALAVHASWSQPPQIIKAGEAVVLHLNLGILSNSQSAFKFSGSARAFLGGANMVNAAGKYNFTCDEKSNYGTVNETVSATPRGSSGEGDKLELEVTFYSSNSMSTKYIYEWTGTSKTPVDSKTHHWQPPAKRSPWKTKVDKKRDSDIYPPGPVYDENGALMDSGIRVSDHYGQCEYLLPDREDYDDQWELLEMNTVLPVNAKIRTREESGAILALADGNTYELKSETTLILTQPTGRRNLLKLVAGNVLTNIKQIVEHGTMEVEMSQAIAGARGTTFISTEDENGSTLKVLEGTVELTPNGKVPTRLETGESINVRHGTVGEVSKFSTAKEMATWSSRTQERIHGILAARGIALEDEAEAEAAQVPEVTAAKAPPGRLPLILGGVLAAGVLGGLMVLLGKKRRSR